MPRSRRTSAGRARPNAARFVRTSSGELGRTPCPKTIILGPYCNVYLLTTPYALKHRLSVRRRFEPEDGVGVTVPAIHAGKFFRVGRFIAARVTGGTGEGGVRRTLIAADRELRGRAFWHIEQDSAAATTAALAGMDRKHPAAISDKTTALPLKRTTLLLSPGG